MLLLLFLEQGGVKKKKKKTLFVFYSDACLYPICVGFSESFVQREKKESDLEESASC